MPQIVSYFVPWGYFVPLGAYEVANWDKITHMVTYGTRPFNWGLLIFTVVLGAVLFYVAWRKSAETGGVEDVKTMHCSRKPETSRVPDLGDDFFSCR